MKSNILSRLVGRVWRLLLSPYLLAVVWLITMVVTGCAFLLIQLPSELQENIAESTRWLMNARATYEFWGDLFYQLGLFNVRHSRLLQLLLTLTGFLALLHLGQQIGMIIDSHRLWTHFRQYPLLAFPSDADPNADPEQPISEAVPRNVSLLSNDNYPPGGQTENNTPSEINKTAQATVHTNGSTPSNDVPYQATEIERVTSTIANHVFASPKHQHVFRLRQIYTGTQGEIEQKLSAVMNAPNPNASLLLLSSNRQEQVGIDTDSLSDEMQTIIGLRNADKGEQANNGSNEIRLLSMKNYLTNYLRMLFWIGLLIVLAPLWLTAVYGWEATIDALAPGESYRNHTRDIEIRYTVETVNDPTSSSLTLSLISQLQDDEQTLMLNTPISDTQTIVHDNSTQLQIRRTSPALWLQTYETTAEPTSETGNEADENANRHPKLLSLPGQFAPVSELGLLFPSKGSEESVLLLKQALGLRLVRWGDSLPSTESAQSLPHERLRMPIVCAPQDEMDRDSAMFTAEIFSGDDREPFTRCLIQDNQETAMSIDALITLADDATPNTTNGAALLFLPLSAYALDIRYTPMQWLFWPALFCMALGLVGYVRRFTFMAVQILPWMPAPQIEPSGVQMLPHSLVIAQSNHAQVISQLRELLDKE
ncbi:MAG: hypothetical protein AAF639_15430 [Chloroflexota bacterium]